MSQNTREEWRPIDGFPNYAVSDRGKVMNLETGKVLKNKIDAHGYVRIGLYNGDGKRKWIAIHRLIAQAFIPNPDNLPQINHIDEVKTNNDVTNLEWVTASQNIRHSAHQMSCKINQLSLDGEFVRQWKSAHEIERYLGYSNGNIISCCKGKLPHAYKFKWEYAKLDSQRVFNRPVIVFKGSEHIGTFPSIKKASEALGLSYMSVYHCLQGHLNSNKGYTFKYLE